MDLMNCSGCGKLLTGKLQTLCSDCLKSHIELTHQIKTYLKEHPGATMMDLYKHMGMPLSKINELVKRMELY